ncbi:unnamed protein product [Amoebophrya sp. A120]|nr:unnamed protein product [Amoebophrya sp. A120]|eukprot:GSA120T00015949001.1
MELLWHNIPIAFLRFFERNERKPWEGDYHYYRVTTTTSVLADAVVQNYGILLRAVAEYVKHQHHDHQQQLKAVEHAHSEDNLHKLLSEVASYTLHGTTLAEFYKTEAFFEKARKDFRDAMNGNAGKISNYFLGKHLAGERPDEQMAQAIEIVNAVDANIRGDPKKFLHTMEKVLKQVKSHHLAIDHDVNNKHIPVRVANFITSFVARLYSEPTDPSDQCARFVFVDNGMRDGISHGEFWAQMYKWKVNVLRELLKKILLLDYQHHSHREKDNNPHKAQKHHTDVIDAFFTHMIEIPGFTNLMETGAIVGGAAGEAVAHSHHTEEIVKHLKKLLQEHYDGKGVEVPRSSSTLETESTSTAPLQELLSATVPPQAKTTVSATATLTSGGASSFTTTTADQYFSTADGEQWIGETKQTSAAGENKNGENGDGEDHSALDKQPSLPSSTAVTTKMLNQRVTISGQKKNYNDQAGDTGKTSRDHGVFTLAGTFDGAERAGVGLPAGTADEMDLKFSAMLELNGEQQDAPAVEEDVLFDGQ